jgi:kynurenine formamidase
MQGTVTVRNSQYNFDLLEFCEIHIPVKRQNGVASFGIENAQYRTYQSGNFIGSKAHGSSCNLETITFTPHGNGTHTECVGHISNDTYLVNDYVLDTFHTAYLITLPIKIIDDNAIVDFSNFDWKYLDGCNAIIIRTIPNDENKKNTDYSGKNAPFIHSDDMEKIVKSGIEHFLIDLPSVDKEWDDGKLASHHIFWNYPDNTRLQASITEFIFVPNEVVDGLYLLKLNIAPFISDAAPSKPTIYPLKKI